MLYPSGLEGGRLFKQFIINCLNLQSYFAIDSFYLFKTRLIDLKNKRLFLIEDSEIGL